MIYTPSEALADPHFVARGFPVEIEHPELDLTFTYPGAPYKFGATPWSAWWPRCSASTKTHSTGAERLTHTGTDRLATRPVSMVPVMVGVCWVAPSLKTLSLSRDVRFMFWTLWL